MEYHTASGYERAQDSYRRKRNHKTLFKRAKADRGEKRKKQHEGAGDCSEDRRNNSLHARPLYENDGKSLSTFKAKKTEKFATQNL